MKIITYFFIENSFGELIVGVGEYLHLQSVKLQSSFVTSIQSQKSLHPVVCHSDATFEQVALKMAAMRIHRIWITDSHNRPISVVSIGYCNIFIQHFFLFKFLQLFSFFLSQ